MIGLLADPLLRVYGLRTATKSCIGVVAHRIGPTGFCALDKNRKHHWQFERWAHLRLWFCDYSFCGRGCTGGVVVVRFWFHYPQESCQWNTWSILRLDPQPHWGIDKDPCDVRVRGSRNIIGILSMFDALQRGIQWPIKSALSAHSKWLFLPAAEPSPIGSRTGRSTLRRDIVRGKPLCWIQPAKPNTVSFDHQPTLAAVAKLNDASTKI